MGAPLARAALTTAAGALALALLGGSAWAQSTPQPSTPQPSTPQPSTVQPSSTGTGGPAPSVPATDPAPVAAPSSASSDLPAAATAPGARPGPPAAATSAPSTSPAAAALPAPTVPSDGVDPTAGQDDAYLEAATARDAAAAQVPPLVAALAQASSTVTALDAGRRELVLATALARLDVLAAQGSADDVARDLYQQGDAGLGAFATILAAGPDGLLDRVDNARMATSTAYGVVDRAVAARDRLARAVEAQRAHEARLAQARASQAQAQRRLDAARIALALADARLAELGAAAPQVAVGVDGCPTVDVPATLRDGAETIGAAALCRSAVRQAATPQAALALTWAFQHLGAVYACKGVGRMEPWRADCSSLVSRAYAEGAGLGTAGSAWAPSTRDMVPWDGVALDPHYAYVAPAALRPGDLVLYDTCPQGGCPYKHVVMYLGSPDGGRTRWMLHTDACGDVAKVTAFWGFPTSVHPFLVARRVVALPGEQVRSVAPAAARLAARAAAHLATAAVSRLQAAG